MVTSIRLASTVPGHIHGYPNVNWYLVLTYGNKETKRPLSNIGAIMDLAGEMSLPEWTALQKALITPEETFRV